MKRNADFDRLSREWGIHLPFAQDWMPPEFRRDINLAMDAQPTLVTTPSSGIPAWLTMFQSPEVVRALQAPNKGAQILGERKIGDWLTQTIVIPMVENTGEVSSYGDFNTNGRSGVNAQWPQRQSYLVQTITEYGEREAELAGLARLNWKSELDISAAKTLNKFGDFVYHLGVAGLQNYGVLNDPSLSPALTPSAKAAGGTKWVNNGVVVATANEVYADIVSLYSQLVAQSGGLVEKDTPMKLVMSPGAEVGLTATNNFAVSVTDLIKKNFPNITIETSVRYATTAGNVVQLIATDVDGQSVGYCAFTEKLREHNLIPDMSSWKQKKTSGFWGAIITTPFAISQLLGV